MAFDRTNIDKRLKDFSDEEIMALLKKYQDPETSVEDLISEYKFDIKASLFYKLFPMISTEKQCEYCSLPLYTKVKTRTGTAANQLVCISCGHKEYPEFQSKICTCENCKEKARRIQLEKREQIRATYRIPKNKTPFQNLEFKDQVLLLQMIYENNGNPFNIAPYKGNDDNELERRRYLYKKGYLSVSPESPLKAFPDLKGHDFPHVFYMDEVILHINVELDDETVTQLNSGSYFRQTVPIEQQLAMLKEYIYQDAIENFEELMDERRLELHISDEADSMFHELIDKISYTQLTNLCFQVARFLSDKVLTGDMSKRHANNAALLNVSKFYERNIENGWTLSESRYENAGPRLKNYVTKILGKDLSLLKHLPTEENLSQCPDFGNKVVV